MSIDLAKSISPGAVTPERDALGGFDTQSGNWLERLLFNHRRGVIGLCAVLTLCFGWQAVNGLRLNASYLKSIPSSHPYILNFLAQASELGGVSNTLRIAVETTDSRDIFDRRYIETLRRINDELYLMPGVDRGYVKSLWTPATRWMGVTEEGFDGGPVMPEDFDGSQASLGRLRANVERSGEIGQLVASDFRSSLIILPLLETDQAGAQLDYAALSQRLETLRDAYAGQGVRIHIVGFAKVMGDLLEGLRAVLMFFSVAFIVTAGLLYAFTRCVRSTGLVLACTLVAVVWLLGLLSLLGYALNPYSILVPFLIFAIGVSHGAQKMNGIMQDIGKGSHKLVAARLTFRRLFMAGAAALVADVVGFALLAWIDIPVIRELAIISSLGVLILVFTNLALLPVALSFSGVAEQAARRSLRQEEASPLQAKVLSAMVRFTRRPVALPTLFTALGLGVAAWAVSQHLQVGDLDPGAPELRAESRYNRDSAFFNSHYQSSSDVFIVMVRTPPGQCASYDTLDRVDLLEAALRQVSGVDGTQSLAALSRAMAVGMNEGNPKWFDLVQNQSLINAGAARAPRELFNQTCDLLSVYAFLRDHKAQTLQAVSAVATDFASRHDTADVKFLLAAGSAGVEAATNEVVGTANHRVLLAVYAAVTLLCLLVFRSWRAVVCAVLPLVLTSLMAEALMVALGMGVKVATLPVVALGVGIGVDYALYNLSVTLDRMRAGESLEQAYSGAMRFTGRVVLFTGLTLALGVVTWVMSPIRFQADMGLLLTFMFLWNMAGALMLVPALAWLLLGKRSQGIPPATKAKAECA